MIHERKNYSYLDFIKIKNVCFVTGMQDNEKKKKATDWEKIFAKYLSDKCYPKYKKTLTTQQENNLIKKWTK